METRLHRAISVLQFHFYFRGVPLLELKHLRAAQRVVSNKDLADFYRAAKRGFSRRYLQVCQTYRGLDFPTIVSFARSCLHSIIKNLKSKLSPMTNRM